MPNKYAIKKGWSLPKQKFTITNWSEYNAALRSRGDIEVWLSEDAIAQWYEPERVNDGTGVPKLYSDFAILVCHEIRMVYRLPLRQCQGFIDSMFRRMGLQISCPDYTVLSTRLKALNIKSPKYSMKKDTRDETVHAIAIDSTGLKRFGRSEWHQEKHEVSSKASWRKLHIAVNQDHYIEACELTDRFNHDDKSVESLLDQIPEHIDHFTADGAYDETPVYDAVISHSLNVDVVIPPRANAIVSDDASLMRNRNIQEIKEHGRMQWQERHNYGARNNSELSIQRYKRILGDSLHSREIERQKQEAIIGCGVLNKMTSLGMPKSYRAA